MDLEFDSLLIVATIAIVGTYLLSRIRIVSPGYVITIKWFGRYHRTLDPGIRYLWPLIESKICKINTKVQVMALPRHTCFTSDGVSVDIDVILFFKITDPKTASIQVDHSVSNFQNLALYCLNQVINYHSVDSTMRQRNALTATLTTLLNDEFNPWGVTIERVNIRHIKYPTNLAASPRKNARLNHLDRPKTANAPIPNTDSTILDLPKSLTITDFDDLDFDDQYENNRHPTRTSSNKKPARADHSSRKPASKPFPQEPTRKEAGYRSSKQFAQEPTRMESDHRKVQQSAQEPTRMESDHRRAQQTAQESTRKEADYRPPFESDHSLPTRTYTTESGYSYYKKNEINQQPAKPKQKEDVIKPLFEPRPDAPTMQISPLDPMHADKAKHSKNPATTSKMSNIDSASDLDDNSLAWLDELTVNQPSTKKQGAVNPSKPPVVLSANTTNPFELPTNPEASTLSDSDPFGFDSFNNQIEINKRSGSDPFGFNSSRDAIEPNKPNDSGPFTFNSSNDKMEINKPTDTDPFAFNSSNDKVEIDKPTDLHPNDQEDQDLDFDLDYENELADITMAPSMAVQEDFQFRTSEVVELRNKLRDRNRSS